MANPKGSIEGTLVSVVGRPFERFKNRDGEWVEGGVSYRAFISEGFDQAPTGVKAKAAIAEQLKAAGPGALIKSETWIRAKGDRVEQELDGATLAIVDTVNSF